MHPEVNPAHLLADLLRQARQARPDRTQEALARILGKERSTVSKTEQGRVPAYEVLCDWLDACGVTGLARDAVMGVYTLARNAEDPKAAQVAPWFEAEARAHTLRYWQCDVVPGILQSERYAYEILRAGGRPHERATEEVAARMRRQAVLARDDAPTVVVVLDELVVLHRLIGTAEIMAEQCHKLLEASGNPCVLLHILPCRLGANPGLGGAISLAAVAGEADTLLTGSLLEDRVTADPAQVRAASATFERVRALSGNIIDSKTSITEAKQAWQGRTGA
jgi:transcriptional regulator with XRE-family HTH domain